VCELESHMRNAVGDSRVCVRVYVHPNVGADRVSNSKEGLEPGCQASTEFHDSKGGRGGGGGSGFVQVGDMVGRWSGVLTPWWGVRCE
jgi:hypothetical protein